MAKTYIKDPDAVLDYSESWAAWLAEVSDTLASATFTVDAGLTKDSEDFDATTATVWLSGGTADQTYKVKCHVVTTAGREDDRSFAVTCKER